MECGYRFWFWDLRWGSKIWDFTMLLGFKICIWLDNITVITMAMTKWESTLSLHTILDKLTTYHLQVDQLWQRKTVRCTLRFNSQNGTYWGTLRVIKVLYFLAHWKARVSDNWTLLPALWLWHSTGITLKSWHFSKKTGYLVILCLVEQFSLPPTIVQMILIHHNCWKIYQEEILQQTFIDKKN